MSWRNTTYSGSIESQSLRDARLSLNLYGYVSVASMSIISCVVCAIGN